MADQASKWILNFHGIGRIARPFDPGEESVWVSVDQFREILDSIVDDSTVKITFDDGNVSDLAIAVPELASRKLSATFFIPAGKIGAPGFLRPQDVESIAVAGMGIGSHGWAHRPWRRLDRESAHLEFVESKRLLEEITSTTVDLAACPFGAYDRSTIRALVAAGDRRAYTSDRGWSLNRSFLEPRNTVHSDSDASSVLAERAASRNSIFNVVKQAVKRWR